MGSFHLEVGLCEQRPAGGSSGFGDFLQGTLGGFLVGRCRVTRGCTGFMVAVAIAEFV